MKKGIEWLKKRELIANIKSLAREVSQEWPHNEMVGLCDVLREIDESEVLSQVLPVIPSYMAEYLELAKSDVSLMRVLEKANRREELLFLKWEKEYAWISANDETFARAWLDGYKVEEEPLYTARLKVITGQCIESYLRTQSSNTEDRLEMLEIGSKYGGKEFGYLSEFTEHELKVLDIWDSDQWVVEEVEESEVDFC